MGLQMTKSEMRRRNAEDIALRCHVFTRKAHRAGNVGTLITELLIAEVADTLRIYGQNYSVLTVKRLIKSHCAEMNELHLIAPKWGRP